MGGWWGVWVGRIVGEPGIANHGERSKTTGWESAELHPGGGLFNVMSPCRGVGSHSLHKAWWVCHGLPRRRLGQDQAWWPHLGMTKAQPKPSGFTWADWRFASKVMGVLNQSVFLWCPFHLVSWQFLRNMCITSINFDLSCKHLLQLRINHSFSLWAFGHLESQ